MPPGLRDCNKSGRRKKLGCDVRSERIEIPGAIASEDRLPGLEVLHKKTIWVKFDRDLIVGG